MLYEEEQKLFQGALIFLLLWATASTVWTFWLESVYAPIAGLLTASLAAGLVPD